MSNTFVVLMGLGTVFVGLIAIIFICKIMGALCQIFIKEDTKTEPIAAQTSAIAPAQPAPVENKQEIIAACCAAIAEELGTDVSGIKVVSFKRV